LESQQVETPTPFVLLTGDVREKLAELPDESVDSIVTDPPYELGFMGKSWDKSGVAFAPDTWRECLRVLKPGGHLLAFGGSRTYHRMASAIEDGGFEIRDQIMWLYGSGFPKSLNVSKAIDKAAGVEREVVGEVKKLQSYGFEGNNVLDDKDRGGVMEVTAPATDAAKQWDGWGTALKPAHEPIVVARKPFDSTVAANVLKHGTGAINVDACRIGTSGGGTTCNNRDSVGKCLGHNDAGQSMSGPTVHGQETLNVGRWPANVIHDGSDEVLEEFSRFGESKSKASMRGVGLTGADVKVFGKGDPLFDTLRGHNDTGTAARFFYCAKASRRDREEGLDTFPKMPRPTMGSGIGGQPDQQRANNSNTHPTVKPNQLMRYLCKLVTPRGGIVLDPFMGSGSTGKAAMLEGFHFIGIDLNEPYVEIARARITHAHQQQKGLAVGPQT
jgi:DNA modification methylase